MICLTNDKWEHIQEELAILRELEQESIRFYCGAILMRQWREVVRRIPEAKRLVKLGQEKTHDN